MQPQDNAETAQSISAVELQNIKRIFQQFDEDHSNSIDVEELEKVMASLGVLMEESQLKELVEQVTAGDKEELSFDEFLSLIMLWKEASQYKLFDGKGFKSLAQQHVEKALETKCLVTDAPWRSAWEIVVSLSALLFWIWVLLVDAYGHDYFDLRGLIAGDAVLTFIFIVDIVLCSRTCYVEEVRLQDNPRQVFAHYLKTWMVPDVLAAIPFDLILTLGGATVAASVLRHLRFLKIFKIPFFWQSSGAIPISSRYIQFHFHVLPILQLLLIFVVMVHGYAIGLILLKHRHCADPLIDTGSCTYPYTPAVYFVLYSLSTVGLGDIPIRGDSEQWYASFVLLGAMATNGIVIGKLVAILQRADIKKERRAKLRETLAVLDHFSIPQQLQEEILQFQAHVFEHNLGTAYENIISGLPVEMCQNISLFVKMKLITNVPMFQESHYMLRIAVAQALENAVARPEQYVIVAGQDCDGLYFLAYGFADVFTAEGAYDGTLRSGDHFGDGALLGDKRQLVSVKAITYCDLWVLNKPMFGAILKRFPKFNRRVEHMKQEHQNSIVVNPLSAADQREMKEIVPTSFHGRSNDNAPAAEGPTYTDVQSFRRETTTSRNSRSVQKLRGLLLTVQQNKARLQKLVNQQPKTVVAPL